MSEVPLYLLQRRQCRQAILNFLNSHGDRRWRTGEIHKMAAGEFNYSCVAANLGDLSDTRAIKRYCSGDRHTYQSAQTNEAHRKSD